MQSASENAAICTKKKQLRTRVVTQCVHVSLSRGRVNKPAEILYCQQRKVWIPQHFEKARFTWAVLRHSAICDDHKCLVRVGKQPGQDILIYGSSSCFGQDIVRTYRRSWVIRSIRCSRSDCGRSFALQENLFVSDGPPQNRKHYQVSVTFWKSVVTESTISRRTWSFCMTCSVCFSLPV